MVAVADHIITVARLEERFDALEAGQKEILATLKELERSGTDVQVRLARIESDLSRRPTYKESVIGMVAISSFMVAIIEMILHVTTK